MPSRMGHRRVSGSSVLFVSQICVPVVIGASLDGSWSPNSGGSLFQGGRPWRDTSAISLVSRANPHEPIEFDVFCWLADYVAVICCFVKVIAIGKRLSSFQEFDLGLRPRACASASSVELGYAPMLLPGTLRLDN